MWLGVSNHEAIFGAQNQKDNITIRVMSDFVKSSYVAPSSAELVLVDIYMSRILKFVWKVYRFLKK